MKKTKQETSIDDRKIVDEMRELVSEATILQDRLETLIQKYIRVNHEMGTTVRIRLRALTQELL